MKLQFSIRDLLLMIAIVALAAGWWFDHQRINHIALQQWEYKTAVEYTNGPGVAQLNKIVSEGWEVCGMTGNPDLVVYLLRRPTH